MTYNGMCKKLKEISRKLLSESFQILLRKIFKLTWGENDTVVQNVTELERPSRVKDRNMS
jgi:hypothetical protein